MAAQAAAQHGVERHAAFGEPAAQCLALAHAERAELVVVGSTETGLAVAHEVQGSHGGDCRGATGARLSPA